MEKAPFAGQLDRVVTIWKTEFVPNELSEHKETLVQVAKPRAVMKDINGSKEIEGSVRTEVNRSYIIRRYGEIARDGKKMILQDRGVKYSITYVKEIERSHLELIVVANE